VQRGGDSDGGGLVAGDEEQHGLLPDLAGIQRGAGVVAGGQQQADQVVAGLRAAGGDQPVGHRERAGESSSGRDLPRGGEPQREPQRAVGTAQHLLRAAPDAVVECGRGGGVVGAEHGAADCPQGQPNRRRGQVEGGGSGRGQLLGHPLGLLLQRRLPAAELGVREHRADRAALAGPVRPIAGQQAVAEPAGDLVPVLARLAQPRVTAGQHLLHARRGEEPDDGGSEPRWPEIEAHDLAQAPGPVQHAQRIAAQRQCGTGHRLPRQPR
jgi:hypothetical protein